MDEALLFAFLLVFLRCSAMMLTSPIFGAQNTPLQIRIFTTFSISGALTFALAPHMGPVPKDIYALAAASLQECVAGLLLGSFVNLALQAAQMAGAIMDLSSGLAMSQEVNPITGVPVTILSQFKFMLAIIVFLSANGHHLMLQAFAQSYQAVPNLTPAVISQSAIGLITSVSLLAVQIATPVLGASMIVDAALSLVSKAVPQMQTMMVGGPAKTAICLCAVAFSLPVLTSAITNGTNLALTSFEHLFK